MTIEEIVIFMIKDVLMYLPKKKGEKKQLYRMVTVLLLLGINSKRLRE